MKRITFLLFVFFSLLIISCSETIDEIIEGKYYYIVSTEDLKALSYYQGGLLPAVQVAGEYLPSQLDDINGNGVYDEVSFVSERDDFEIIFVNRVNYPVFEQGTNIRFAKKEDDQLTPKKEGVRVRGTTASMYQMEGPAWENDLVGFRNYFDERNGMDIFGKKTTDMVLDTVGINASYHVHQPWGMDILKVGSSLGAGAIALLKNDSLYRIGPDCKGTYRYITSGPVRSVFELKFEDFTIGNDVYTITHQITIWKGDYRYESKVWLEGGDGTEHLVTGIVNMKLKNNDTLYKNMHDGFVSLTTHDKQADAGEYLALGFLIPENNFLYSERTPDSGEGIVQSYYAVLNNESYPVSFHFYSGWEKTDQRFANKSYLLEIIESDINLKH